MNRRWKQAAALIVIVFAAAQVIRPDRTNPTTDPSRTIEAQLGASAPAVSVIERACSDCHSNGTVWPWYTRVAPVSWVMIYGVRKGRKVVNFSEWASYSPQVQQSLMAASCRDVSTGKMPGPYTLLHPEMRLSPGDVETICAVARQAEAHTTERR
jgi:heme-binding protein